jgi:hypothetical protein
VISAAAVALLMYLIRQKLRARTESKGTTPA